MLAALVIDRVGRARVQEALRSLDEPRFCERAPELIDAAADPAVRGVLAEPFDRDGCSVLPALRSLRRDYPTLPVVVYGVIRPGAWGEIVRLHGIGIHDFVIRDHDDHPSAFRTVLDRAIARSTAEHVIREAGEWIPGDARPVIELCLERPARALTVAELSRLLGAHRKTIVRRMRAAGLPAPSRLVGWCRLLHAARMLEDPGRTLEAIALHLDFASASALRNMLSRYTGLSPTVVRERGGLACVLPLFLRALAHGNGVKNT